MPTTHYYDRSRGEVIERQPTNPETYAGREAGRKQRNTDQKRGVYPRTGLPISREGRSDLWIEAYQRGYYQHHHGVVGRPNLGDEARVTVAISCDRRVIEALDLSLPNGQSRSAAIEQILIAHLSKTSIDSIPVT